MRCLLVSYAGLGVNSTEHVAAFGRGMASLGWEVHLAVLVLGGPSNGFRFYSCVADGPLTPVNSEAEVFPFEIVHVWTPRGAIWDFIERYHRLVGRALILHLEDDENEVLRAFSSRSVEQGIRLSADALHRHNVRHLSHPLLARCLASCVDGVTVLSPELSSAVPLSSPCLRVVPPLDPLWLVDTGDRPKSEEEYTVVFSGGVHSAVVDDFYALCRAVGLLVGKGRPIRLIRCGPPAMPPRLLKRGARMAKNFHDAGFLPREKLASLLAGATVLVQPGGPTVFNRRRFPAKLAPYLASGTPVVMPACYDWIGVKPAEHVVMFEHGGAEEIARAIETVIDAPERSREMGKRAAAFARAEFRPEHCCRPLDEFYRKVLEQPRGVPWQSLRQPRAEVPLWLAAHPRRTDREFRAALTKFATEEQRRVSASAPLTQREGPLVSVIVPNFNHRQFLPERFRSIFEQTYRNLEIVVLDDASTDGSLDYLRSLQSPFPLRLVANPTNSGSVFGQWHRGVTDARGEYVWIAESDDSCEPDLIEKLLAVAARNPEIGLVYAQSRIIDANGRSLGSFIDYTDEIDRDRWRQDYVNTGRDEAARYLIVRNTIPNASACLSRRTALVAADLASISLRVCGDWLAYARICEHHDIGFVADELNFFRRHGATARERANRDGSFVAEVYAVQNHIAHRFEVSPEAREVAGRSTFRDLLYLLKNQGGFPSLIEDRGILEVATRFDPRFRERLSGEVTDRLPLASLRSDGALEAARVEGHAYDSWRWTRVRFSLGQGNATIIPIDRVGLVALRRIRALNAETGNVLWAAETGEAYRQIELGGHAQRVASENALEVFSWGSEPQLLLPLPKEFKDSGGYDLEFEIRLAALESYEPSFGRTNHEKKNCALFILPHLELGGADRCNLDLIGQLTKRFGWEITVVTTRRSDDGWQVAFRTLTEDVFMLHRFLPVARYPDFLAYLIESRRPEVVYLSHSEVGYRLLPWLKESFPGLPVVDLLHLVMEDWKQGGFPRFSAEAQRWLAGTIVTSQWLKSWLVQRGGDERRIRVVYTGIDPGLWRRSPELAQVARARWELPTDRPVLLFSGRFAAQKSLGLFPKVVAALEARGRDFLLVFAGEGALHPWLEKNLCEVHPRSVRMLGAIPADEMRVLMSAADILVLPSQAEGVALVLFEAMSMGVVPVATDVGGQRELVTPECGRLVALGPNLAESLVEALDTLLVDPHTRARMAAQGRARIETNFPLDHTGEQIEALFREHAKETTVNWENLPTRSEVSPGVLAELNDIAAQSLAGDEWSRQVSAGKWLPTAVSRLAAFLRAAPGGQIVRRLERRYGERVGRWIVSRG